VTTFGELIELKAGVATFDDLQGSDRNRWADYNTTVLDPSNPYSFWTFQAFTHAKDQWGVQITQIRVDGPATRTDLVEPNVAYSVRDDDSDSAFDNLGDGRPVDAMANVQQNVGVGERDTTIQNRVVRLVSKFQLPDTPGLSDRLESATLRLFLEGIEGTPAGPDG
jgi:hypothetical protein